MDRNERKLDNYDYLIIMRRMMYVSLKIIQKKVNYLQDDQKYSKTILVLKNLFNYLSQNIQKWYYCLILCLHKKYSDNDILI